MSNILELKSVSKTYMDNESRKETPVLKNINLKIGRGEKIAIMGPSGEGKSTLLNIIIGAHKPTSGKIIINGQDISNIADDEVDTIRARELGVIYQHHNLLQDFNVAENIYLAQMTQGYESDTEVSDILENMGLLELKNANIDKISGGQRQRVAIARAMCGKPSLIIADEPTGNLDSGKANSIAKELFSKNCAMVLVTHDIEVARMADKVYKLENNELRIEE
jgi:putative ABC transport system ATP-binding protein